MWHRFSCHKSVKQKALTYVTVLPHWHVVTWSIRTWIIDKRQTRHSIVERETIKSLATCFCFCPQLWPNLGSLRNLVSELSENHMVVCRLIHLSKTVVGKHGINEEIMIRYKNITMRWIKSYEFRCVVFVGHSTCTILTMSNKFKLNSNLRGGVSLSCLYNVVGKKLPECVYTLQYWFNLNE